MLESSLSRRESRYNILYPCDVRSFVLPAHKLHPQQMDKIIDRYPQYGKVNNALITRNEMTQFQFTEWNYAPYNLTEIRKRMRQGYQKRGNSNIFSHFKQIIFFTHLIHPLGTKLPGWIRMSALGCYSEGVG